MNRELFYLPIRFFAQGYGCGAYGETEYNTCETEDTTSNPETSTGNLSDTGILVAVFVFTAVVVLFVSLAVRFWKNNKSKADKDINDTDL